MITLCRAAYSTNVERVALALAQGAGRRVGRHLLRRPSSRAAHQRAGRSIASRRCSQAASTSWDEFSAADCAAFPFLKYALRRDPADGERLHRILDDHQQLGDDHPRLTAWIERVDARPRV
jgi:glutathione S-transferase